MAQDISMATDEGAVYTVGNQKGGIGKTATSIGQAGAEADRGKKTLLIETDPSAHIARGLRWSVELEIAAREKRGLPIPPELEQWRGLEQQWAQEAEQDGEEAPLLELYRVPGPTLFQALIPESLEMMDTMIGPAKKKGRQPQRVTAAQLIRVLPYEQFDLVPSHAQMVNLQGWLYSVQRNRENRLRDFVLEIIALDRYDRIIIDTPPDLGPITDNALVACSVGGGVIVPVEAETTSVNAIELFFQQIETLKEALKVEVPVLAVVPNKVEDSDITTRTLKTMREMLVDGDTCIVTPFEIRKRTVQKDAYDAGRSVFSYWPTGRDSHKKRQALLEMRAWYKQLAEFAEQRAREKVWA